MFNRPREAGDEEKSQILQTLKDILSESNGYFSSVVLGEDRAPQNILENLSQVQRVEIHPKMLRQPDKNRYSKGDFYGIHLLSTGSLIFWDCHGPRYMDGFGCLHGIVDAEFDHSKRTLKIGGNLEALKSYVTNKRRE